MNKRNYCYRFKNNFLKFRRKDIAEKLRGFGFEVYMPTEEYDEEVFIATTFKIEKSDILYRYLKTELEKIYKTSNDRTVGVCKDMLESGYEFDADGNLIENEKWDADNKFGQLCVSVNGEMRGHLFINLEGIEFYNIEVINGCVNSHKIAEALLDAGVMYKKVFKEE